MDFLKVKDEFVFLKLVFEDMSIDIDNRYYNFY